MSYGTLAYDNAGQQDSAKGRSVSRKARVTRTGAINSPDGSGSQWRGKRFEKIFLLQIRDSGLVMASHGTSGHDQKDEVVGASLNAVFRRAFFSV